MRLIGIKRKAETPKEDKKAEKKKLKAEAEELKRKAEELAKAQTALESAARLCLDKATLKGRQDEAEAELLNAMRCAVASQGVLAWMLATVQGPVNQMAMDMLLQLAQFVVNEHPLQRPSAMQFIAAAMTSKFAPVAVQKDAAQVLVHLMSTGFVHPPLRFLNSVGERIDAGVVRASSSCC